MLDGFGIDILQCRRRNNFFIKGFDFSILIKNCEILIRASLVCRSNPTPGSLGKLFVFEIKWFLRGIQFIYFNHDHYSLRKRDGGDPGTNRRIKCRGASCCNFLRNTIGIFDPTDRIALEKSIFILLDPNENDSSLKSWLIGKGADRFVKGMPDAGFHLEFRVFIELVKFVQ